MNREQFARLPKYARFEIERLRADLEFCAAQMKAIDAGETDTKVARYGDKDIYLPNGSRVVFSADRGVIEMQVKRYGRAGSENGYTVVEATCSGIGHRLAVLPTSSNLIQLEAEDR